MGKRVIPAFFAFVVLAGASAPGEQVITRTSRPVRLLRSWEEPVKTVSGHEYARRVDLVFDYRKGVAYQNFYSMDGLQLGMKKIAQTLPAPSPEEIEEAFGMVRNEPDLARLFARFHPVLEGGFVLEEGRNKPCGPGARCLHVFLLSSDRAGLIERVVVDLARQRIAYRNYVPPTIRRTGR
jgi:hypothetical protein